MSTITRPLSAYFTQEGLYGPHEGNLDDVLSDGGGWMIIPTFYWTEAMWLVIEEAHNEDRKEMAEHMQHGHGNRGRFLGECRVCNLTMDEVNAKEEEYKSVGSYLMGLDDEEHYYA